MIILSGSLIHLPVIKVSEFIFQESYFLCILRSIQGLSQTDDVTTSGGKESYNVDLQSNTGITVQTRLK